MGEHLSLKWGTLKAWKLESPASLDALQAYHDAGFVSAGAAQQQDNAGQKQAICDMIDAIDGEITNDWSGETMTKAEAKDYVLTYGKPRP